MDVSHFRNMSKCQRPFGSVDTKATRDRHLMDLISSFLLSQSQCGKPNPQTHWGFFFRPPIKPLTKLGMLHDQIGQRCFWHGTATVPFVSAGKSCHLPPWNLGTSTNLVEEIQLPKQSHWSHMGMYQNQSCYIWGDEHPFTSYLGFTRVPRFWLIPILIPYSGDFLRLWLGSELLLKEAVRPGRTAYRTSLGAKNGAIDMALSENGDLKMAFRKWWIINHWIFRDCLFSEPMWPTNVALTVLQLLGGRFWTMGFLVFPPLFEDCDLNLCVFVHHFILCFMFL